MALPGQFTVSPTGAATYSIPIAAPPGTAGMVPALSLNYSSDGGDGMVGVGWTLSFGVDGASRDRQKPRLDNALESTAPRGGLVDGSGNASQDPILSNATSDINWSLSGLPAIQRCARTLAQDGIHGGVNYNSNDRFCLGGQRLVVTSGTYGADGSEYRTEIERFARIIAHGVSGNGPAWFEVHERSGLVFEYGNTTDSRVLAVGTATARAWALNKVRDSKTNYFTITYTNDTTNGQAYPTRIDYTGNTAASLSPYNSIQFVYVTRGDIVPIYQAGALMKNTVLLSRIQTFNGTTMVSDYRLDYRAGTATLRSRLTSVTLCDGASNCLAPTTFGWQGGTGTVAVTQTSVLPIIPQFALFADIDIDGLTDIVSTDSFPDGAGHCSGTGYPGGLYHGTALGTFNAGTDTVTDSAGTWAPCFNGNSFIDPSFVPITLSDVDGDGIPEIEGTLVKGFNSCCYDTVVGMFTTTGDGHYATHTYNQAPGMLGVDFNGDGRSDSFLGGQGGPGYAWFSTGLNTAPVQDTAHSSIYGNKFVDFDGDGCDDVAGIPGTGGTTSYIYYFCSPAVSQVASPVYPTVTGDFNGDGKADLLGGTSQSLAILLSTGTGFVQQTGTMITGIEYLAGDWNGDGRIDIAVHSGTSLYYYLSTGTGFTLVNTQTLSSSQYPYSIQDLNADGVSDVLIGDYNAGTVTGFIVNYTPEYMTTVSNGIGQTTTVTYDRINKNGAFYTKATGATYPTQDVDGALYVVSRVDAANGIGGSLTTNYAYGGAKRDVNGRGFLGFSTVIASDVPTGIVTTTTYRMDFPYVGQVGSQTAVTTHTGNGCVAGITVGSVVNTYGATNLGGTRNFVYLSRSDVTGADCENTALPSKRVDYVYDSYGSPTQVSTTVYVGAIGSTVSSTSVVNNTMSNDAANWLFVQTSSSTANTAGSSAVTRTTSFAYQSGTNFVVQKIEEPSSSTLKVQTDLTLDAFGNPTVMTVSGSNFSSCTTTAAYGANGAFMTSLTNCLGQTQYFTNSAAFGGLLTRTDLNGQITSWAYDTFGRLQVNTRPDGTYTSYGYSYCSGVNGGTSGCATYGAFAAVSVPHAASGSLNGPIAQIDYDGLQRRIMTYVQGFDGTSIQVWTRYDTAGRLSQTSRPFFGNGGSVHWTSFAYDDLGRVKTTTAPNGAVTSMAYHGLLTTVTNALGVPMTTVKNPQGLNASVTDAFASTSSYVYDAFGNLKTFTDPAGNVTSSTYDIRGHRTATSDPDMGSWAYTYNALGAMLTQVDAKSQTTTFTYDVLGRLTQRVEPDLTSTWTWDTAAHGVGMLAAAAASGSAAPTVGSKRVMTYDAYARPIGAVMSATDGSAAYAYATSYNSDGRVDTVSYPSGFVAKNIYNAYGYLCRITDNGGSHTCTTTADSHVIWTANTRNAEMQLTQATAGNGVVTTNTYDANTGLLTNVRAGPSDSVAAFDYQWDAIGNLTYRSDNYQGVYEKYCYDSLNRLTQYAVGGSGITSCTASGYQGVGYDALGNITNKTAVGLYSYPAAGSARPHAVSSISGTVNGVTNPTYTYDANGNMTSGAGRTLTLTSFNMARTVVQGSTTVTLGYDFEHNRVGMGITGVGITVYANDPISGAREDVFNNSWHDYVAVDGKLVAERFCAGSSNVAPCTGTVSWDYVVTDHLGSVAAVTNGAGAVVERDAYDPWGKRRYLNGTDDTSCSLTSLTTRGFTGHEHIAAQCLINMNARLYDPTTARFMAPDPVTKTPFDPQSLNRFTYVDNRPLSLTDPTGLAGQGDLSDEAWNKVVKPSQDKALDDVRAAQAALKELRGELKQLAAGEIKHLSEQARQIYGAVGDKFGSVNNNVIDRAIGIFAKIETVLADNGSHYNYKFSTLAQTTQVYTNTLIDPKMVYAYAEKGATEIKLTGLYFNDQSQWVQTLIHEPSHIFGTQDYAYGMNDIRGMIGNGMNMDWNADSYAHFAMTVPRVH